MTCHGPEVRLSSAHHEAPFTLLGIDVLEAGEIVPEGHQVRVRVAARIALVGFGQRLAVRTGHPELDEEVIAGLQRRPHGVTV